jgi:hypothetical protein
MIPIYAFLLFEIRVLIAPICCFSLGEYHICFYNKQQSVIQQLLSRNGRLIVMCSKGDASATCPSGSCRLIEVLEVADCLQSVISIIPLQVRPIFASLLFCQIPAMFCTFYTAILILITVVMFLFLSAACIPSYCSSWIQCGPTKELGEESDRTINRGDITITNVNFVLQFNISLGC